MPFIGNKPSAVPLTSADIADSIITSAKIVDGTIVNADINASAAIDASKLTGLSSDWVKIAQTNVTTAVSSVDFVNGSGGVVIDSTYRIYKILCSWRPSSNGAILSVRVANSGTFRTADYLTEVQRSYYSGGTDRANDSDRILRGLGGTQNASEQRSNAELTFYNMSDATLNTTAQMLSQAIDGSGNSENQVNNQQGGGVYTIAEAHNGIRIYMSTGNIEAGEFTLVGLKG